MILLGLILIPLFGIFVILTDIFNVLSQDETLRIKHIKFTALTVSIFNLFFSGFGFVLFDYSSN